MEREQPAPEHIDTLMPLVEAAILYAQYGWPVFPLHGKVPYRETHGHKEATTDRDQIQAWWSQHPGANIGLATGEVSGVIVLDMDVPEGYYNLKTLQERYGQLPHTRTSRTANGGLHFFFQYPNDQKTYRGTVGLDQLIDIDIRAQGNYVVLPPSRLYGRKYYSWARADLAIAPAPDWLLSLLVQAEELKQLSPQDMRFATTTGEKWLHEALMRATEGNR